jgi:hypothetical protein
MASKEPPLIRSSKAFSVEIPEGSSSAKSRRSDVVAGLDEGIAPSDPHFEAPYMLSEQTMGSESDSFHDTSININADQRFRQPNPTFTDESMSDHQVGIANDGLQDHMAAIPQENLADNLASLPNDAIEDRVEAVAEPAAPIPLFVSADDDFPDDHMEIEEVPEVDPNVQALSDEALADHVIKVNVDKAALGDVQIPVSNATRSESANAQSATNRKPAVKKLPAVLTPEMIKMQEAELIANQQKMEEFHGRVEAIRNTVNNINAKLDQIAPVESKPTSH